MSIVKMNKITITGKKGTEEKILNILIKKGFVQVSDISYLAESDEYKNIFNRIENISLTSIREQVEKAMNFINKVHKVKKPLFYSKPYFTELSEDDAKNLYELAKKINEIEQEISDLTIEKQDLLNKKNALLPWINLELSGDDLAKLNTIKIFFGKIPIRYKITELEKSLDEEKSNYSVKQISQSKISSYISIITYMENEEKIRNSLKRYSFIEEMPLDSNKTVKVEINEIDIKVKQIDKRIEALRQNVDINDLSKLENLYDYIINQDEIKQTQKRIVETKNLFLLEGWLPAGKIIDVSDEYIIKYSQPAEDEDFPVFTKNNKLVAPFETITNMYNVPSCREIDPNPIMSLCFIVFFGMMLSDLGYGIILTLATAFIIKKAHYKPGEGNIIKLMLPCGISTMVWGYIFGGFFGDLIKIKPILNPLTDVMQLIGLAWLMGIIQIYIGMFMNALELIKKKQIFSAIVDTTFWYLTLTGVILLISPIIVGEIGIWSEIAKYLALIGAAGLILTQGRQKKGIIGKLIGGVGSLYNITGYFGDILSYSRLMALCLSTGVIAQVGNLLSQMTNPVFGAIIIILVHTVNIANSILGAYVHTSRLQYIEFFGKFYEGGGELFQPLKMKNKFTNIKEEF